MSLPNLIVEDDQISGVSDDGSANGIVKAKIMQGDMVCVPPTALEWTSTGILGGGNVFISNVYPNNKDGSGTAMVIRTSTGGLNTDYAMANMIVYGKAIGIRYRRDPSTPPFTVLIDGVCYGVPLYNIQAHVLNIGFTPPSTVNSTGDNYCDYIVVDNLPDIPHSVQICVYPSATVAKILIFLGLLLERRAGYSDFTPVDVIYTAGTALTTSAVAVSIQNNSFGYMRSLKSIYYYNGDTVTRTVTIKYNGVIMATISMATLTSAKFDFSQNGINPGDAGAANNLTHSVDAITTTAVTSFLVGGKK